MMILERLISKSGREVTVSRIPASLKHTQIRVSYDGGKSPGRVAYFPDKPAFEPLINEVKVNFLEDRDTLGKPFKEASRRTRGQLGKGRAVKKMRRSEGEKTSGTASTLPIEEGFDLVDKQLGELKAKVLQVKQSLSQISWLNWDEEEGQNGESVERKA